MWEEYKVINEEMQFMTPSGECMRDDDTICKYGQRVKVMIENKTIEANIRSDKSRG